MFGISLVTLPNSWLAKISVKVSLAHESASIGQKSELEWQRNIDMPKKMAARPIFWSWRGLWQTNLQTC